MSISKFNPEGYYDPTTYAALSAIEREEYRKANPYRPLVYICSPFAGDMEQNTIKARQYSRYAVEQGAIPFAPHLLYPQFMDDRNEEQRALGLLFCKVWLCKCDELWAFGGNISPGMKLELAKARQKGVRIRFFDENCREVFECTNL